MHQYTVTGSSPFPMDMLRHDQAWPADQLAWMVILASHAVGHVGTSPRPAASVSLCGNLPPTLDRWASFHWIVKPETVRSEDPAPYGQNDARHESTAAAMWTWARASAASDDVIIAEAIRRLAARLCTGDVLACPQDTRRYLRLELGGEQREVFGCLFLTNRHRVIRFERLFFGTIDSAAVHPREIVKAALACNAAACILAHNHPSGVPEPSRADIALTGRVKDALALVDVRVLDHIIVGQDADVSLAEKGML